MKLFRDDAAGCWATTLRGYHCCRSGLWGRAYETRVFLFLWVAMFWFLPGGTAGGCCAWAAAPGICHRRSRCGKLARHTPRVFWASSSSADLPFLLSILCCLLKNDDLRFSLRLSLVYWCQERHRVLIFPVPCRVVSIWYASIVAILCVPLCASQVRVCS